MVVIVFSHYRCATPLSGIPKSLNNGLIILMKYNGKIRPPEIFHGPLQYSVYSVALVPSKYSNFC